MTDDSDIWPLPRFDIGQPKHMHALGIVAATYNQMEFSLFCLLLDYTGLSSETTQWLVANTSNNTRLELLRRCIDEKELDQQAREHAHHFSLCYDICAENRNFLMHSMTSKHSDNELLAFFKSSRNNPKKGNHINLRLEDLRNVAEALCNTWTFGMRLHAYYCFKRFPQSPDIPEEIWRDFSTLPKKPQLPSKLLRPHPPTP